MCFRVIHPLLRLMHVGTDCANDFGFGSRYLGKFELNKTKRWHDGCKEEIDSVFTLNYSNLCGTIRFYRCAASFNSLKTCQVFYFVGISKNCDAVSCNKKTAGII